MKNLSINLLFCYLFFYSCDNCDNKIKDVIKKKDDEKIPDFFVNNFIESAIRKIDYTKTIVSMKNTIDKLLLDAIKKIDKIYTSPGENTDAKTKAKNQMNNAINNIKKVLLIPSGSGDTSVPIIEGILGFNVLSETKKFEILSTKKINSYNEVLVLFQLLGQTTAAISSKKISDTLAGLFLSFSNTNKLITDVNIMNLFINPGKAENITLVFNTYKELDFTVGNDLNIKELLALDNIEKYTIAELKTLIPLSQPNFTAALAIIKATKI